MDWKRLGLLVSMRKSATVERCEDRGLIESSIAFFARGASRESLVKNGYKRTLYKYCAFAQRIHRNRKDEIIFFYVSRSVCSGHKETKLTFTITLLNLS